MNKSNGEQLREKLFYAPKNAYERVDDQTVAACMEYAEHYKAFMNSSKTERECVSVALETLQKNGFVPFEYGKTYAPGTKIYFNNRDRALVFAIIGQRSLAEGVNIAAAHIDSPRLDMKPGPVYEDTELCLMKTHYYGGVKKYQWTAIPLALHGVIVKKDGTKINVKIGECESDPIFCITDLLPHLSKEQYKRDLREAISGEALNVLVGSRPFLDDKVSEKVKLNILQLLFEKYDVVEEDLFSAELTAVPAFKAQDLGFDRSMIGAYGHDDKVCAYPCLTGLLASDASGKTLISVLADKEEIGSTGNTGLHADYLKNFILDLCRSAGVNELQCLHNSKCLSADVNAGFDPTYPEPMERRNSSYLNYGTIITKYTGSAGKSGTSDASAEFFANIRRILDESGVIWQSGELGKVDAGGGGTVAKFVADLDIDVVDLGVPVLSMHAPFEVISKMDLYMTHRAVEAFFKKG